MEQKTLQLLTIVWLVVVPKARAIFQRKFAHIAEQVTEQQTRSVLLVISLLMVVSLHAVEILIIVYLSAKKNLLTMLQSLKNWQNCMNKVF